MSTPTAALDSRAALETLLGEEPASAATRADRALAVLGEGEERPLVLYGAGRLGRRTLRGLSSLGAPPLCLADADARLWGTTIDGVPVLEPREAVGRFGETATFVVAIWNAETNHQFVRTRDTLTALGARRVAPLLALYWRHAETFLPYYALDRPERVLAEANAIRAAFTLLSDEGSRAIFVRSLRFRLWADHSALPTPGKGPIYFPKDLVPLGREEVFVDGGAFDGDSLRSFLAQCGGQFARALAFEPDPSTFARLAAWAATLPENVRGRLTLAQTSLGARRERLHFAAEGMLSSAVSARTPLAPGGNLVEVDCDTLDALCAEVEPTFLKLDIEGAEIDALAGATAVLQRSRPSLALSAYHCPDHLWRLPTIVAGLLPGHRLVLRPHGFEGWDLVLYALSDARSH